MATIFLALGLVLILEGLVYVLAPSVIERLLAALRQLDEDARRLMGATAVVMGLILVWIAHQLGV